MGNRRRDEGIYEVHKKAVGGAALLNKALILFSGLVMTVTGGVLLAASLI